LLGPEIIKQTIEKVNIIKAWIKAVQDRQKSDADRRRHNLEFLVRDYVFVKVMPIRGIQRFRISGKFCPHYVGPFEIVERVGSVTYLLALPSQLANVHDILHVSML